MIKEISIKNFKSIVDLTFNPGRFNVLIGENGCGKSNILEAISYGVAASLDKLDNEYLGLRGIRISEPQFMVSAFEKKIESEIDITFLTNENFKYLKAVINPNQQDVEIAVFPSKQSEKFQKKVPIKSPLNNWDDIMEKLTELSDFTKKNKDNGEQILNEFKENPILSHLSLALYKNENKDSLKHFTFYCPEESALRTFKDDVQMLPFGVKGNGLFRYLKELSKTEEGQQALVEIRENLRLLDWFDTIDVPTGSMSGDYTVNIKDRYIAETLQYFDQRSTNEGFLYLLFYLTLFISKDTPSFFAIDNLESSFNPKMCTKIVKVLKDLAEKHDKQVIVTTHSPFILDGLDLENDEERLFVVRRNDDGHTKIKRIEHKVERTKKLSEVWMSGAIGGLPDNF